MRLRLKYHRIVKGLTIEEMSIAVGLACMTYRNYEYGTHTPRIATAQNIAGILDCTLEEVLENHEEHTSNEMKCIKEIIAKSDRLLRRKKKKVEEGAEIQEEINRLICNIPNKFKRKKSGGRSMKHSAKILPVIALGIVIAQESAGASGFGSYFTGPLTEISTSIRTIGAIAALCAGSLFFMTMMKGDGGSLTGQALKILVAIAGVLCWATGGATTIFSDLSTSGLCF